MGYPDNFSQASFDAAQGFDDDIDYVSPWGYTAKPSIASIRIIFHLAIDAFQDGKKDLLKSYCSEIWELAEMLNTDDGYTYFYAVEDMIDVATSVGV